MPAGKTGKMALTVGDWILEAESLLEKKSVNEAVDLLNRIGEPNICVQKYPFRAFFVVWRTVSN